MNPILSKVHTGHTAKKPTTTRRAAKPTTRAPLSAVTISSSSDYTNLIGIYNICVLVFICVFACSEANLKNELKKLKTYKDNTTILAANEPKPADCKEFVFVSAPLTVKDPVSDSEFGVHTDQCYLERHVEVF